MTLDCVRPRALEDIRKPMASWILLGQFTSSIDMESTTTVGIFTNKNGKESMAICTLHENSIAFPSLFAVVVA